MVVVRSYARAMRELARVDEVVQHLLQSWNTVPAFIRDEHFVVLASNAMARSLTHSFERGVNLALFAFLDPETELTVVNFDEVSAQVAGHLRDSLLRPDAELRELVSVLMDHSSQFSEVWAADLRAAQSSAEIEIDHPQVGRMSLTYQQLALPGNDLQVLVVWRAGPDSASQSAFARLTMLVADASAPPSP